MELKKNESDNTYELVGMTQSDMLKITEITTVINIQVWDKAKHPDAYVWDDIPHTQHLVFNVGDFARKQKINGSAVRVTYPMRGVKVGSLNGHYF